MNAKVLAGASVVILLPVVAIPPLSEWYAQRRLVERHCGEAAYNAIKTRMAQIGREIYEVRGKDAQLVLIIENSFMRRLTREIENGTCERNVSDST